MTTTKIIVQLIDHLDHIETRTVDANRATVEPSGALTLDLIQRRKFENEDGETDFYYHTTHVITYNQSRWLEYTIIKDNKEN